MVCSLIQKTESTKGSYLDGISSLESYINYNKLSGVYKPRELIDDQTGGVIISIRMEIHQRRIIISLKIHGRVSGSSTWKAMHSPSSARLADYGRVIFLSKYVSQDIG